MSFERWRFRRPGARLLAVLLAWTALGPEANAVQAAEKSRGGKGFEMSVGVTLLTVTVAVLDGKGRYRTDLEQADFELLVDGQPETITDFSKTAEEPLDLAILLDVSGSMRYDQKLDKSKVILRDLLGRLKPDDQVALLIFADGRIERLVPFTKELPRILASLETLQAFGKTALSDALGEAAALVQKTESLSPAIILLTDGYDNASRTKMSDTLETLRWHGVPIYTLAVVAEHIESTARNPDEGSDFDLLRKLSAETGGRFFAVASESSMDEAVAGIETDLRSRYRLGYYGADTEKKPRALTVNVDRKGFKVRYRRGYRQ